MIAAVLATSYAPGHNFWPGTPVEWWLRGSFAFALMAGPILVAWLLALLLARRVLRSKWWIVPLMAALVCGLLTNSVHLRDGDRPLYIGGVWGQRLAPWLLGAATLTAPFAFRRPRSQRAGKGFDVVVGPRESGQAAR